MKSIDRISTASFPWIGLVASLVALLLVAGRWNAARADADALRAWQSAMVRQIGAASARPAAAALTPDDAAEALAQIIAARDGAAAMAAAAPVTGPAVTPPVIAVPASTPRPGQPVTSAAASHEISRLRKTQSTGTAAGDAQIIDQDSRAAWSGWQ